MDKLKQTLKTHYEWFLGSVALFLFGVILAMFVWGIALLVRNFAIALSPPDAATADIRFKIQELRELNLRGYTQQ